jgi:hypothetical protein
MKSVAFGPAEISSGKNKGTPTKPLSFASGIKPENNTSGLPVDNGKVMLRVSAGDLTISEVESAYEVRELTGEHFDTFVVDWANDHIKSRYRQHLVASARGVSLAPSNIVEWFREKIADLSVASIFTLKERAEKKAASSSAKAFLASAATITPEMLANPEFAAQFLAQIQAVANKGKKA